MSEYPCNLHFLYLLKKTLKMWENDTFEKYFLNSKVPAVVTLKLTYLCFFVCLQPKSFLLQF